MPTPPARWPETRREGFGWRVWSGPPEAMPHAHQHDEIEVNLVRRGRLSYLRAGEVRPLEAGQAGLFWGAGPHRLLECSADCLLTWLTLPTVTFQRFSLPLTFRSAVWDGALLVAEQPLAAAQFARWQNDPPDREHAEIAELEVQAWLRRFALSAGVPQLALTVQRGEHGAAWGHALALARQLQQDFASPLRMRDLAAGLGLHPNYLSGVFRQVFGVGPHGYLIRCRLAQAQALLIASELSVLQVALESGFPSSSRFFAVFAEHHGCTPRAYRQAHRQGAGG